MCVGGTFPSPTPTRMNSNKLKHFFSYLLLRNSMRRSGQGYSFHIDVSSFLYWVRKYIHYNYTYIL